MISSLVITLGTEPWERDSLLQELRSDQRLTLGELNDVYLPLVLDTSSVFDGRDFVEKLSHRPGVLQVDLVEAHFEEADLDKTNSPASRNGGCHA